MYTVEFQKLLAFCLLRKVIIITIEASSQNKKEMYKFKGFSKLITNPYVGFKKIRNFRRIHLNYNYEDWEKTQPDVYDDFLTKSKVFSTTTAAIPISPTMPTSFETTSIENTTTNTIPTTSKDIKTNIPTRVETTSTTIEDNITNTSTSVNDTHVTVQTTQQVTISKTEIISKSSPLDTEPSLRHTTTPITPEITTTSILSSGSTTTTSAQETTTLSTASSTMTSEVTILPSETIGAGKTTPVSPFVTNIKNVKNKLNCGYFTASLAVILREIADKEAEDLQPLMTGFHGQVMSMITNNELAFLGYPAVSTIAVMSDYMYRQYPETMKEVAKQSVTSVENRHDHFMSDTNIIMDLVDTIYVEEDARNIASVLDHLRRFPGTDKSAEVITREGLDALIFIPWSRILGDPRERLLRMELTAAINKRTPVDAVPGRRHDGTMKTNNIEDNLEMDNMSPTTMSTAMSTINETTHEYQYLKNATIVNRLKKKMRSYQIRMSSIRYSEWKLKTRRGPTTTTTTTTIKPTMHKSKYYRMKKSKKLYRMKTTIKTTTKFRWRYYGKVRKLKKVSYRKFNDNDGKISYNEKSHTTKSNACSSDENNDFDKTVNSDSDSYYSETDSSYEDSNLKKDSNSFDTLTRHEKSSEVYKSNENTKVKGYDNDDNRNYKNNNKLNVKRSETNQKLIEPYYVSTNSFESHKKEHDKYPERDYLNSNKNDDRKYKSYFKGIDPKYKTNTNRYDNFNSYRNKKFVSRIKFSTRITQIRHPIGVKNYKSLTKSNINNYDYNYNKNNAKSKRLNVKRLDINKNNNGFHESSTIGNYNQKVISRNTKDKYNTKDIALKEHKKKASNKLDKYNRYKEKLHQIDRTYSGSIDDERLLKANIEDAIYHREHVNEIMDRRRNLGLVKVNKFQVIDSGSDVEVKLKEKIYKVFGFSDNFGKRLRTVN